MKNKLNHDHILGIRLRDEDVKLLNQIARKTGINKSTYCRDLIRKALRKDTKAICNKQPS